MSTSITSAGLPLSTIGDPCGEGLLDCFEHEGVRTRRSLEVGP